MEDRAECGGGRVVIGEHQEGIPTPMLFVMIPLTMILRDEKRGFNIDEHGA